MWAGDLTTIQAIVAAAGRDIRRTHILKLADVLYARAELAPTLTCSPHSSYKLTCEGNCREEDCSSDGPFAIRLPRLFWIGPAFVGLNVPGRVEAGVVEQRSRGERRRSTGYLNRQKAAHDPRCLVAQRRTVSPRLFVNHDLNGGFHPSEHALLAAAHTF